MKLELTENEICDQCEEVNEQVVVLQQGDEDAIPLEYQHCFRYSLCARCLSNYIEGKIKFD